MQVVSLYTDITTYLKGKVILALTAQTSDKMLTGGFLSADDFTAQYLSRTSDTFKSFIVAPESTRDKTDRYLRNRWEIGL